MSVFKSIPNSFFSNEYFLNFYIPYLLNKKSRLEQMKQVQDNYTRQLIKRNKNISNSSYHRNARNSLNKPNYYKPEK